MTSPVKVVKFHLFNCDNTYKLDSVKALLLTVADDLNLKILVDKRVFRLHEMQDMCENTIPMLQMDYAVLVVEANESRLSINEDNAGIGYAKIYRTLLRATGNKVLIVIGGDKEYKDESEEENFIISRWARRKVASQFDAEYLDGRKSFIFSWNKEHREIHRKALEHYLDPSKKGQKFQYVAKQKPAIANPQPSSSANFFASVDDSPDEGDFHDDKKPLLGDQRRRIGQEGGKSESSNLFQESNSGGPMTDPNDSRLEFLEGTVLLDTSMRFGRISYEKDDVKERFNNWEPSVKTVRHLSRNWMFRPLANVTFVATVNGGVSCTVQPQSFCSCTCLLYYLKLIWDCLVWIWSCILLVLVALCEWLGKKFNG